MKIKVIENEKHDHGVLARIHRSLIESVSGTKHDSLRPLPKGEYTCDEDMMQIINFAVSLRELWVDRLVEKSAEKSVAVIEAEMKRHEGITGGFEQIAERINGLHEQGVDHTGKIKGLEVESKNHQHALDTNRNERLGQRHWAQEKFDRLTDRFDAIEREVLNLEDEGLGDPLFQQFSELKADHDALCLAVERQDPTIPTHFQRQLADLSVKMQANQRGMEAKFAELESVDERIDEINRGLGYTDLAERVERIEKKPGISIDGVDGKIDGLDNQVQIGFKNLGIEIDKIKKTVEEHPITGHRVEIEGLKDRITTLEGEGLAEESSYEAQMQARIMTVEDKSKSLNKVIPNLTSRITTLEGAMAANDAIFDEQELTSRVEELAARLAATEEQLARPKTDQPEDMKKGIADAVRVWMSNNMTNEMTMLFSKVENMASENAKELEARVFERISIIESDTATRVDGYLVETLKTMGLTPPQGAPPNASDPNS